MPTFQDDPLVSEGEGTPIIGESAIWVGVSGETNASPDVGAAGIWVDGKQTGNGVKGVANAPGKAAVCGFHEGTAGDGMFWGVYGESKQGRGVHGQYGPIGVGDLLTTSASPGFAMQATDAARACGAVIGKALRPLQSGQSMIPILVALQ